jgi:soluble lytic murein transglycosylase-like protein
LSFGGDISAWADHYDVPIELIVATICTESSGKPLAVREEPGYISDEATPAKVSVGLMQTLIATARGSLRREGIAPETVNRVWLSNGRNSIRAGTAYIREQVRDTGFDPPKVACAYNAGSVRHNASPQNRWKMRQFPIDSSEHADRFVRWFNDCVRFFAANNLTPVPSFRDLLRRR